MYEIIWSIFYDKLIMRSVSTMGNVKPLFIDTEENCIQWLKNHNSGE
jgi:hypothetical protein